MEPQHVGQVKSPLQRFENSYGDYGEWMKNTEISVFLLRFGMNVCLIKKVLHLAITLSRLEFLN